MESHHPDVASGDPVSRRCYLSKMCTIEIHISSFKGDFEYNLTKKMFLRRIIPSNVFRMNFNRLISETTKIASDISMGNVPSPMKLTVPKRAPRKKATNLNTEQEPTSYFNVCAYATADWYDLDRLKQRLLQSSNAFQLIPIPDTVDDVLCVQIAKTKSTPVNSQAFIFDDGVIVFWNVENADEKTIFKEVNQVSDNQYPRDLVNNEKEKLNVVPVTTNSSLNNDLIKLNCHSETEQLLDKYTVSNALALSVKLGIWEALLDDEVEFVADLANRLKQGEHIKIKHGLMQRKSGELYSLKHAVNLSHDFLDTPDYYWSNSRLENLYKRVFNYFTIAKRTKVLNERLNFSLELISVIEASLNEKKHVRLEWIIIILIGVEVFFNIIDHLDFLPFDFISKSPPPSS